MHARGIRVVLRWIEIVDTKEPVWQDHAQFRFAARITTGGATTSHAFPERGHYNITDQPRWNRVVLNRVIFAGEAGAALVVEVTGEELDRVTADEPLDDYRREFTGSPQDWIGVYEETLSNWRIGYTIEAAQD